MGKILSLIKWHFIHLKNEPHFSLPYLILPTLTLILYMGILFAAGPQELQKLIEQLHLLLVVLLASTSIILSSDSFAGEKERNTLETLLLTPLTPSQLFWGKVLSILPLPLLFVFLGQSFLFLTSYHLLGDWQWELFFRVMVLSPLVVAFVISLGVYFSLSFKTVRGAGQVSGIGVFFLLISLQLMGPRYFNSWNYTLSIWLFFSISMWLLTKVSYRRFSKNWIVHS